MREIIKKADIALVAFLLLFCAGTAWFAYGFGSEGAEAEISVDGKLYGTYPLSKDNVIDIDTDLGHNQVIIKDGRAYMAEASCPDGYCLGQHKSSGGINRSDQTIVCLPNKVVVSVSGDTSAGNKKSGSNEDADGDKSTALPDAVAGTPAGGGDADVGSKDSSGGSADE